MEKQSWPWSLDMARSLEQRKARHAARMIAAKQLSDELLAEAAACRARLAQIDAEYPE